MNGHVGEQDSEQPSSIRPYSYSSSSRQTKTAARENKTYTMPDSSQVFSLPHHIGAQITYVVCCMSMNALFVVLR